MEKRNVGKPLIFINRKKKTFQHIELLAKLLDYFSRSSKSNINQSDAGDLLVKLTGTRA